jgi:hypothetical protein
MHKFYTSSYDASIYLQQPDQNAGRDEILEVGKLYYGTSKDINRTLIKFDVNNIETGSGWKAFLNLKSANSQEIPLEYMIYANAVSQSWTMGTGTKFDNITSDGVSWYYKNGTDKWMDYNVTPDSYVSGSDTGSILNGGGGTWYTASMSSQSFSNEPDDVRMDVTNIVRLWLSGSLPNNGFIIHHSIAAENDASDYGLLKFFSKETNTIYEPKLEIVYDDYSFTTGSLEPAVGTLYDGDYKVIVNNLKNQYFKNTKVRVRVKGRESYPSKSFGTTFSYEQIKRLPADSTYYQLEDYITGEVIFPFGQYTKVSCDSTSNYFDMDLNSLSAGRIYKLKLKIEEDNISTIIDEKMVFEIIE